MQNKSLRTRSFSTNCVLASYLSDFTCKITECCKQELTSCLISLIPSFLAEFMKKMYLTKLLSVTSELWVHIKCNNHNYLDYRSLQNSNKSWYCIECCSTIFPFNSLLSNKNFFSCCTNTDNNNTHWIDLVNDHNSSLSLKPSSNLELLVNQFNDNWQKCLKLIINA